MKFIPKGCIFDLDGVICDTAKYHYLAWKKLARELNIPFTEQDNEQLKGVSRMDSLKILLSLGHLTLPEQEMLRLADQKNNWYKEYIKEISSEELLPGVADFLSQLRSHGMKIALGSVSRNAPAILHGLRIQACFDTIIDGNAVTKAKPDPEVFLSGARMLRLAPEECLVFEDAASGIKAAHNANMHCIGIGNPDILTGADHVISSFLDFSYDKLLSLNY